MGLGHSKAVGTRALIRRSVRSEVSQFSIPGSTVRGADVVTEEIGQRALDRCPISLWDSSHHAGCTSD
jgi:hypothetical protein